MPPPGALSLRISDDQFAIGQTATSATSFQGLHAAHILVIADEAAGLEEHTWEGIDALLTSGDARLLLIGNPTTTSGRFFDTHHALRNQYKTFHISAERSPNFTGEEVPSALSNALITPAWVESQREAWGEDSPMFRARVMGDFPDQAEGALIALSWIEAARDRDLEPLGPARMGLDVARHGSCENVATIVRGPRVIATSAWRSDDLMDTAGRAANLMREYQVVSCAIDATGMGAGVFDRLKEQGMPVAAVWVGEQARDPEKFTMVRDELAWALRERFRTGDLGGLVDARTQAQCSAVQYAFDSRGRIKLETKEDMQKRGLPSPDRFDSLALAFHPGVRVKRVSNFGKAGGWM